jgi:hypothetical protein
MIKLRFFNMMFQNGAGVLVRESFMTSANREITRHYDDVPPGTYKIILNNSNGRLNLDYLLRVYCEV